MKEFSVEYNYHYGYRIIKGALRVFCVNENAARLNAINVLHNKNIKFWKITNVELVEDIKEKYA